MLKWFRRGTPAPAPAPEPAPVASVTAAAPAADPDALMRRAFAAHEGGAVAEAQRLYREILRIDPGYADAHYLLGRIEHEAGRHEEALPHLQEAVRRDAGNVHFQKTLGEAWFELGRWREALGPFQQASALAPDDFELWSNTGCALEKLGRLDEASRCFEKALAMAPDSPAVLNNVALSLKDRGRIDEALAHYRRVRELVPEASVFFSNYLYALTFSRKVSREEVFRAHADFDRFFGTGRHGSRAAPVADRDPERRLRIGYFSPDLRSHPVAVFLEGVLHHHDGAAVETHCYHLSRRRDAVSDRLRQACDRWTDCAGLDDAALAARIREDGIDVLVDLAGHTADNRLPALGLKPAPVIATWLGYPNTTGLRTVDYRITDAVCDPAGAEAFHTEAVWRLPGAQWCYERPPIDVPVSPLPAAGDGHVRFASFNNAAKITDEMLRTWALLLQRVQPSSLLVWGASDELAVRARQVVREAGTDPARVEFSPRTPFAAQLAVHQRTDIALDTFPYTGVTTTFNSLWMGVPVLSIAGEASASRSTLSILTALGLEDWVAGSPAELVELAARKVADLPALAQLRAGLRERLQDSPLMDGPGFARKLEAAYRAMWRAHLKGGPAA